MPYKYETKNCRHCEYCVKTDKGLYCSHREGHPKVTSGGWCIDWEKKESKINDDLRYYGNPMDWESTKGDIISRDTLLNEFNTKCQSNCPTCEYRKWNSKLNRYECELITTAPAVSFAISPDFVTKLQNHNKELIKQLEEAERPQDNLIHSLTELCNRYCENCPTMSEKPDPNDCTDCICTHIRGIIGEEAQNNVM